MFRYFIILFIGIVLSGSGCAWQSVSPQSTPQPVSGQSVANTVKISKFSFSPAEMTINKGEKVVWQHDDAVVHTIVSVGNFESPTLSRGDKFDFTFNQVGEYNYYCSIHPSMTGKIIVK